MALGYEGPETFGAVVGAAGIVLAAVVITLLAGRWLVTWASGEDHPFRG